MFSVPRVERRREKWISRSCERAKRLRESLKNLIIVVARYDSRQNWRRKKQCETEQWWQNQSKGKMRREKLYGCKIFARFVIATYKLGGCKTTVRAFPRGKDKIATRFRGEMNFLLFLEYNNNNNNNCCRNVFFDNFTTEIRGEEKKRRRDTKEIRTRELLGYIYIYTQIIIQFPRVTERRNRQGIKNRREKYELLL